jgi:sugar phosphate isomerase/epimerase
MYPRRDFGKLAIGGLVLPAAAAGKIDSVVGGVQLGVISYSYRDRPLEAAIRAMVAAGLGECELIQAHVEPGGIGTPPMDREALRKWRLTVSLDEFAAVRKNFDDAGILLWAYNYAFGADYTNDEIDRGFEMARALGARVITSSLSLRDARRVAPFAEKHRMTVAVHGHFHADDANLFATPESFAQALAMSRHFAVNLDIGHFSAAGFDPIAFIRAHHDRTPLLHLKDRKNNQGPGTPWGEGDTPIREVLQLLKKQKYPIRAYIEYEYDGTGDAAAEVEKCLRYTKNALA